MHIYTSHNVCVEVRGPLMGMVLSSTMWVLEIELRLSDLAEVTFPLRHLTVNFYFLEKLAHETLEVLETWLLLWDHQNSLPCSPISKKIKMPSLYSE